MAHGSVGVAGQVVHLHTAEEEVSVVELVAIEDKKTGEIKRRPRFARQGAFVTVRMRVSQNPREMRGWAISH
jgi:translation elongation factor EF-1alpha